MKLRKLDAGTQHGKQRKTFGLDVGWCGFCHVFRYVFVRCAWFSNRTTRTFTKQVFAQIDSSNFQKVADRWTKRFKSVLAKCRNRKGKVLAKGGWLAGQMAGFCGLVVLKIVVMFVHSFSGFDTLIIPGVSFHQAAKSLPSNRDKTRMAFRESQCLKDYLMAINRSWKEQWN